ncbi:MAG: hypothetical protein DWQ31_05680 [Planctomycetota bacterium]|nr:MAG: hypothetical protein DWQ31_05680 [Planctomycetota bacterium]REK17362.1 MAG: hypothetical protein DWQ42_22520 [Planctomycetota bacterium]REK46037.1 MAG: hypothetical protein DWQ46_07690 [Planctomycetota bacterium]
MERFPDLAPLDIIRRFNSGEMTDDDVIHWAEDQVALDNTLGREGTVIELAMLSCRDNNSQRIAVLLEDLVMEVVDFDYSDEQLARLRERCSALIRKARPGSIDKKNCMDFIIGCCPQTAAELSNVRRYFKGDVPGLYNELSAYSKFIVHAIENSPQDLDQAVRCLDSLFVLGDSEIRNAGAVGVIESVLNICGNSKIDAKPFIERLLPASKRAHVDLEKFWNDTYPSLLRRFRESAVPYKNDSNSK